MHETTIARNYAETLLELARREKADLRLWGQQLTGVADAMTGKSQLRLCLESPKVSGVEKGKLLTKALEKSVSRNMLRFLQTLVRNRRQMLIPEVAREYLDLVDAAEGRMHARVTVARETPDAERDAIAAQLSRMFGKTVVPHLTVDPSIMGGIVVHVGDTVLDGSVRKRLQTLRRRMLVQR